MTRALTRGRRAFTAAALTAVTAVLLGAAGLTAVAGGGSARAAGAVVLDGGELDLVPRLVDGKPELQIDDRGAGDPVVREPGEVVLHADATTLQHTSSPLAEAFGLVSQDMWQLGGQRAAEIFAPEPGWKDSLAGGGEVALSDFTGPGVFGMAAFTRDMEMADEPPAVYLGSGEGAPRAFTLDGGGQRHTPTWLFSAEGVYRLTFTVTAGARTDTEVLAVVVGDDVDPATVLPGDGSTPPAEPTATDTPTSPPAPTPTPAPTATAPAAHVIGEGHLDLAPRPVDGRWQFQVKEGSLLDHRWYEPDEVVLQVRPGAKRRITQPYDFLGAVGEPVWWLPVQQTAGLVWPGFSTEQYGKAQIDGDVAYRLDEVRGPGTVAVFSTDGLGGVDAWFNSGDGLPDTYDHNSGAHSHADWAFTKEGVYRLTFTVSATLTDGTKVSDTETLAWAVGDVDPATVRPGAGGEPTATPSAGTSSPATSPTASSPTPPPSAPAAPTPPDPTATDEGPAPRAATPSGALASTGAQLAAVAGIALAAVLAGGAAVLLVRHRRTPR
ncbi:choice-of-anchor M domain-containing protein [Streptomyces polyrhachis]|uniref:Choice-of-anchor M domain-containing protein n=1 Tax=Streptomyces polyrhachis TaxID=1282885 RepID=A0ABW2GFV0_9ACTN